MKSSEMLTQLRADRAVLENKFSETATIANVAEKYGVKKAGRNKMIQETSEKILAQIQELRK